MVRLRATLDAVPSRVWTSVVGLAVLASLSLAVVLGAGLEVWRGAVGLPAASPPTGLSQVPHSGLVTVPSPATHRGHAKATHPTPAVTPVSRPGTPASPPAQPAPSSAPSTPAPHGGTGGSAGGSDTAGPPVVSVPVFALDSLLVDLRGPRHRSAVTALSALVLRPALAWSVDGAVVGEGRDALVAIIRRHAPPGIAAQILAHARRSDHGGTTDATAPATHPRVTTDAHPRGTSQRSRHAQQPKHHRG